MKSNVKEGKEMKNKWGQTETERVGVKNYISQRNALLNYGVGVEVLWEEGLAPMGDGRFISACAAVVHIKEMMSHEGVERRVERGDQVLENLVSKSILIRVFSSYESATHR